MKSKYEIDYCRSHSQPVYTLKFPKYSRVQFNVSVEISKSSLWSFRRDHAVIFFYVLYNKNTLNIMVSKLRSRVSYTMYVHNWLQVLFNDILNHRNKNKLTY